MKLIYRIIWRLTPVLALLLTLWAVFFYLAVIDEVNDEVDDSLEDYSELIITRFLAGKRLPSVDNGTNNSYHIARVGSDYAEHYGQIRFLDSMVYLREKKETEPARILKTVFRDGRGDPYELTVSIPTIEKEDLRNAVLSWIVLLYGALLLAVMAVNVWVFHRNLRPLYVLLEWLDRYSVGGGNVPLDNETKVTEFRRLNEAAERSARRNRETFERQRQFIANASHEMQTPLAAGLSRLEMLLEDPGFSRRQLEEIVAARRSLEHLVKLNRSLLLLSRIEDGRFPDEREVSLGAVVRRQLEDFSQVYAYRRMRVSLREEGDFRLTANESLAEVLTGNLLRNAYVHAPEGGALRIGLTESSFTVVNTAEDGALDAERIFERFYQGGRKEGSAGLGLALADSVCRLYRLRLRYFFRKGEHVFEVSRPEKKPEEKSAFSK